MDKFSLRCAVERLRSGLFDAVAVKHLTVEQHSIENVFSANLQKLDNNQAEPLCICGSYGQGKSHTLAYLNQLALDQGYATSIVQLDAREIPFHQFSIIYQSIAEHLSLPDGKNFLTVWKKLANKTSLTILETMPHRFKMILTAILAKNKTLSVKEIALKKHQNYKPKEFNVWLEKAWLGYNIPATHLKSICKYRELDGYKSQALSCKTNDLYFQMIQAFGLLLKDLGYKGLILFFDEAESITQLRIGNRLKSYDLLDKFFQQKHSNVFPIFAFTEDFFNKVNNEAYDSENTVFPKNYAQDWAHLNIFRLQDFSAHGWEAFLDRLIQLYAKAYSIDLPVQIKGNLQGLLDKFKSQELRFIQQSL